MMLPACLPAAVAVGHLNPQVCENELVETVQVIGGEQVRERERERRRRKRDKDTACRRLRGPSFPASCLLPHILRSSGASRAHRSSAPPPLRPPACPPAPVSAPGMKRVRHFARPQQQQRQQLGSGSGTDGQTSARGRAGGRGRPLAPSCAARWRCLLLSLSLGNSQLTLCSLVPSLPTYACSLDFPGMRDHVHIHRRGPKDFGGKKMGAKENDDCCT